MTSCDQRVHVAGCICRIVSIGLEVLRQGALPMKCRVLFPAIALAICFASSQVQAFEFLDRMMGRGYYGGGCGSSCCEPACCEPACCEPACCETVACEP